MNRDAMRKLIIENEGYKNKAYICPAGKTTIGIGRNLTDKGLNNCEVEVLFQNDLDECLADLNKIFKNFFLYPESVQQTLCDMRFQLGHKGFSAFKNMIDSVKRQDWKAMIKEMKDSAWYKQVPNRAEKLIKMVEGLI